MARTTRIPRAELTGIYGAVYAEAMTRTPASRSPEPSGWRRVLARAAQVPDFAMIPAWFNGMPGARVDVAGAAAAVGLVAEDGRISRIYAIANPRKLGWPERTVELRRLPT